MVFAHCVPSKWHLRMCFKLLHTPQIHWNQCHIFHIFLYCICFYIHNFSSVFPAYILVSHLPLGQAWTARKTLTFALWITGTSSTAKLGASTRWQQKPHPASLSHGHVLQKKRRILSHYPSPQRIWCGFHAPHGKIPCQRRQMKQFLIDYRWAASVLCEFQRPSTGQNPQLKSFWWTLGSCSLHLIFISFYKIHQEVQAHSVKHPTGTQNFNVSDQKSNYFDIIKLLVNYLVMTRGWKSAPKCHTSLGKAVFDVHSTGPLMQGKLLNNCCELVLNAQALLRIPRLDLSHPARVGDKFNFFAAWFTTGP